jgi:hypothetical protein
VAYHNPRTCTARRGIIGRMAKKKPHRSKDRHKPRKMVAVHPALHAQVAQLAGTHGRQITAEVREALRNHLRAHGVEPVRPAGED